MMLLNIVADGLDHVYEYFFGFGFVLIDIVIYCDIFSDKLLKLLYYRILLR